MTKDSNVRCMFCGKDLGGFVFEHNCEKKANNKDIWNTKVGRRDKPKSERQSIRKIWTTVTPIA